MIGQIIFETIKSDSNTKSIIAINKVNDTTEQVVVELSYRDNKWYLKPFPLTTYYLCSLYKLLKEIQKGTTIFNLNNDKYIYLDTPLNSEYSKYGFSIMIHIVHLITNLKNTCDKYIPNTKPSVFSNLFGKKGGKSKTKKHRRNKKARKTHHK